MPPFARKIAALGTFLLKNLLTTGDATHTWVGGFESWCNNLHRTVKILGTSDVFYSIHALALGTWIQAPLKQPESSAGSHGQQVINMVSQQTFLLTKSLLTVLALHSCIATPPSNA